MIKNTYKKEFTTKEWSFFDIQLGSQFSVHLILNPEYAMDEKYIPTFKNLFLPRIALA